MIALTYLLCCSLGHLQICAQALRNVCLPVLILFLFFPVVLTELIAASDHAQTTPKLAKKAGSLGHLEQDKQTTPVPAKKVDSSGHSEQTTPSHSKKAGGQSEQDKPCSSRFSKLTMRRCLPKETCDDGDGDDDMTVTPVAQSAVEKMPATYSLTNSSKSLQKGKLCTGQYGGAHSLVSSVIFALVAAKGTAKSLSTAKSRKSEQSTSKAVDRDIKRRSTEESASEAKKKRRSRDKGEELKEVGGVPLVCGFSDICGPTCRGLRW